ncbi:MAG TPA: hypothetical protein VF006_17570 [Longimicrobium sp.]
MTDQATVISAPEGAETHEASKLGTLSRDTLEVAAGATTTLRGVHLVTGRVTLGDGASIRLEDGSSLEAAELAAGANTQIVVVGTDGMPGTAGQQGPAGANGAPHLPGGNGGPGGSGSPGGAGMNAPSATLQLGVVSGVVTVVARGGNGGPGGPGGTGGAGGNGGPQGGAGGRGGDGGPGGGGGNAGNGSTVQITYAQLEPGAEFQVNVSRAQGGPGGAPGAGGPGGMGTPSGAAGSTGMAGAAGQDGAPSQVIIRPA